MKTERTQRTENKERCGRVWSEPEHEVAHCRQLQPKIDFLFFLDSSSAVREKGEVSRRTLHCRTESGERQRELSRDEPRRVFEKAALLSEGGMAMEYGPPFQEGRTAVEERMDGWIYSTRVSFLSAPSLLFSLL